MPRVPFMVPPSQSKQFIHPPYTSGFSIKLLGGSDSAQTYITADKLRCKCNQDSLKIHLAKATAPPLDSQSNIW